jgi:hypothetical protein
MDKGTLITVVAIIDNIQMSKATNGSLKEEQYAYGYLDALDDLSDYFQRAIDADVAAMESQMGEPMSY